MDPRSMLKLRSCRAVKLLYLLVRWRVSTIGSAILLPTTYCLLIIAYSGLLIYVSRFTFHVLRFASRVSRLASRVSRLTSHSAPYPKIRWSGWRRCLWAVGGV